jgi:hypothetical protein
LQNDDAILNKAEGILSSLEGLMAQLSHKIRDKIIHYHVIDVSEQRLKESYQAYSEQLIAENNSLVSQVHHARTAYSAKIAEMQQEVDGLKHRLSKAQWEVDDLMGANRLLEAKIREVSSDLQAALAVRPALEQKAYEASLLMAELDNARASLSTVQGVADLALTAASTEASKSSALGEQMREAEFAKAIYEGQMSKAQSDLELFKARAQERVLDVEQRTRDVLRVYEARLQQANEEMDFLRRRVESLRSEASVRDGARLGAARDLEEARALQAEVCDALRAALRTPDRAPLSPPYSSPRYTAPARPALAYASSRTGSPQAESTLAAAPPTSYASAAPLFAHHRPRAGSPSATSPRLGYAAYPRAGSPHGAASMPASAFIRPALSGPSRTASPSSGYPWVGSPSPPNPAPPSAAPSPSHVPSTRLPLIQQGDLHWQRREPSPPRLSFP